MLKKPAGNYFTPNYIGQNSQLLSLTAAFIVLSACRFISSYMVEWINIPDSAWYASSANSFYDSFRFLIGGKFNAHTLPLYSILISPAYYFDKMGDTFTAIKFINSFVKKLSKRRYRN